MSLLGRRGLYPFKLAEAFLLCSTVRDKCLALFQSLFPILLQFLSCASFKVFCFNPPASADSAKGSKGLVHVVLALAFLMPCMFLARRFFSASHLVLLLNMERQAGDQRMYGRTTIKKHIALRFMWGSLSFTRIMPINNSYRMSPRSIRDLRNPKA